MNDSGICHSCFSSPPFKACTCRQSITPLCSGCISPHMQLYGSVQHLFIDLDYASNIPKSSISSVAELHSETSKYISELMKFKGNVEGMIDKINATKEEIMEELLRTIYQPVNKLQACVKEINHFINLLETHASKPMVKGENVIQEFKILGVQAAVRECPLEVRVEIESVKTAMENMINIIYKPIDKDTPRSTSFTPHVKSQDDPSQAISMNDPPQYKSMNDPPQYKSQNDPPQYKIQNDPPQYKSQNDPPQYKSQNDPPQYKSQNDPPQHKSMNDPPQYKSMNDPPQYKSMNDPPQYKSMNDPPQAKSQDEIPQYKSTNDPPQYKSMKDPPQAKSQDESPYPMIPQPSFITCDFCKEPRDPDFIFTKKQCTCIMCCFCLGSKLEDGQETCPKCLNLLTELQSKSCTNCHISLNPPDLTTLPCSHIYCKDCITNNILDQMYKLNHSIFCPDCKIEIFPDTYEKLVNPAELQNYYYSLHASLQPIIYSKYSCMNCEREYSKDRLANLGCFHYFCKGCLTSYLTYKIENKVFSSKGIECLSCQAVIDPAVIKEYTSRRDFDNYIKALSSKRNSETKCPMCYKKVIAQTSFMQCDHCHYKFCIKCSSAFHIGDCPSEYVVKLIESFSTLIYKVGHCPACKTIQAKRKGTKDRTSCRNPECGIVFCMQCSKGYEPILAHGPHYHTSRCEHYATYRREDKWAPARCTYCKDEGRLCKRT